MEETKPDKVALAEQTIPESPSSLSNVTALARFEFEPGKGNEGTKILMVEWQDEDLIRSNGLWEITWSRKTTVLEAEAERKTDNTRRLYFLLPPNVIVPPQVTLCWKDKAKTNASAQSMTVLVLPAIFTPELAAKSKAGVLHTIWAKSRLKVLEREIKDEQALNLEGIALEMALSERDWILSKFSLPPKAPPLLNLSSLSTQIPNGQLSPSLQSPRTPGGRRLSEKLKGLSIGTSELDLARGANTPVRETHPLSPEGSDIAYSSFSSFRQGPLSPRPKPGPKMTMAEEPPEHIKKQQRETSSTLFGYMPTHNRMEDEDESLFAVALSPRTPDVSRSPFSFQSEDIAPYKRAR